MTGLPCPVCKTNLVMAERQGIEIDHCPNCRGVWLDRGELDKIIERSAAPVPRESYREPERHYEGQRYEQRGGHYPQKRKRSFLEDLFD